MRALRDTIYDPRRAITNSLDMKFALIPAGEFLMGSPVTDGEVKLLELQHRVRITRPFYLGVHEVTRGQFRRFVDATGYQTDAERDGDGGEGWIEAGMGYVQSSRYTWRNAGFVQSNEHPVVNVSWNDAVAFADWLSRKEGVTYRLPTEAEWEYACRAGTTTRYCNGDDPEGLVAVANIADGTLTTKYPNWATRYPASFGPTVAAQDGFIYTAPVGHYNPNAWGLFDMHGNVMEWCRDGFPVDGAGGRVHRGGSWFNGPRLALSASRLGNTPDTRSIILGFRVARVQAAR